MTDKDTVSLRHMEGLHRGYADNLTLDWDRPGKGGYSSIALLNANGDPVAVVLGDYIPGRLDADMDAAATLFAAAPDLLEALTGACDVLIGIAGQVEGAAYALDEAQSALAKATGKQS